MSVSTPNTYTMAIEAAQSALIRAHNDVQDCIQSGQQNGPGNAVTATALQTPYAAALSNYSTCWTALQTAVAAWKAVAPAGTAMPPLPPYGYC